jgi:hypothetical protein
LANHLHPPQRGDNGLPQASLRRDCALYFRDLAVAAIVFLPIWSLLYLLRVLVPH